MCILLPLLFAAVGLPARGKTFHVDGVVISVDRSAKTVTVSHRPIPKYMGAMVMPFQVEDGGELEALHPGNRVEFELIVGKSRSFIRRIRRLEGTDLPIPAPANRLETGVSVPDFALVDQNAAKFLFSQLRGKVVVLNFLYTRCPLPDVCPRLAANFAALQRKFPNELGKDFALVSITLDPEYDTPAVLKEYGRRWAAREGAWFFLTGSLAQIERISGYFGLVSWAEEGTLSHTSSTAVVSRDGKLVGIVEGSTYRLNQLSDLVQSELGGAQ